MNLESSSSPTVTDTRHVEVNTRTALCSGIPRATSDIVAAREKMRCLNDARDSFSASYVFVGSRSLVRSWLVVRGLGSAETSPSLARSRARPSAHPVSVRRRGAHEVGVGAGHYRLPREGRPVARDPPGSHARGAQSRRRRIARSSLGRHGPRRRAWRNPRAGVPARLENVAPRAS